MSERAFCLDEYMPFRLSTASNSVGSLISYVCESLYGLKIPEWRIIAALYEAGPMTQYHLGKRTCLDKVTVSRAVQNLVKRHMVKRFIKLNDGRSHHLALTHTGQSLFTELIPVANNYEAALLASFAPAEVEVLKKALLRIQIAADEARHPAGEALRRIETQAETLAGKATDKEVTS